MNIFVFLPMMKTKLKNKNKMKNTYNMNKKALLLLLLAVAGLAKAQQPSGQRYDWDDLATENRACLSNAAILDIPLKASVLVASARTGMANTILCLFTPILVA